MPDEAVHGGFRAFRSLPHDPVDAAAFRNPSSFKEYWRRRRTFCAQSTSFSVMEFMLAFGSVGDFIAVAKLIKDIIAALDDCRGSAKNYRDVVRELEILHRTVQQVERIYDDNTLDVHLDDLKALATSNLAQINGSLHDFRDRTQKFSPGLNEDGTKNRARDAFWKIQWKFKEHEVIKFKDEIRGHTASLSMLLGITNIRLTQRSHQDYIEQALNDENRTLDAIKRSGQSMKRYVGAIGKQLFSKLSSVAEIGIQIQRSTSNIMTMMVALSGELNGIKSILMRLYVDRPLSDEYFTLEDSTGRVFPIHLRTITSWDAFEYVLMDRFKGKKGAHRVKKKRYTLKERASDREVNRSLEWESAFLPHQMVDMSLMCSETSSNAQKRHPASCPWCHEMSPGKAGAQAQCKNCNMFFTRVVELDDAEILPKSASKGAEPRRRAIRFSEPAFPRSNNEIGDEKVVSGTPMVPNDKPKSCGPQYERLNRKRPNTAHDSDSDDEDFQGHTRITVVSKGKRPGPFFAEQQETFATAARRLFENATGSFMKDTHTDAARPTQFLPKSSKQNVHYFKFGSHARDKSFSQSIPLAQGFEDIRKTATGDLDEDSDEESLLASEQTGSTPEEVLDMPEQIPYAPEQPNYRRRKDLQIQLNTESEDNENMLLPYEPEMMAWMRATIYLGKYLKKPQPGEGPFCGHEKYEINNAYGFKEIVGLNSDATCPTQSDQEHPQPREWLCLPQDYVHPREDRKCLAQEWRASHPSSDALLDWTTPTQDWPAVLQNGAFDYKSLGKWIYDCVKGDCSSRCPISLPAYNLWQVLSQLTRHMLLPGHCNFLEPKTMIHNVWKNLHIEGLLLLEEFRCHIKRCEASAFGPGPYPEDFQPDDDMGRILAQRLFEATEPSINSMSLLILEIASFNMEFSGCESAFRKALGNRGRDLKFE